MRNMSNIKNSHVIDAFIYFLISLESFFVTWGLSGTDFKFAVPMLLVALLIYVIASFSELTSQKIFSRILPIILLFFLIICGIQYLNYKIVVLTEEDYSVLKNVKYCKYLPSSILAEFYKGNALRTLIEIGSLLGLAIALCKLFSQQKFIYFALLMFAINITIMSIFAILQSACDMQAIYGIFYTESDFYGTFPLSNAFGAFVNMGVACLLALAYIYGKNNKGFVWSLSFIIAAILCSISIYNSQSKASFLLNFVLWGGFILLFVRRNKLLMLMLLGIIGVPAVVFVKMLDSEIKASIESRMNIYEPALTLISKNPVWGYGGYSTQFVLSGTMLSEGNNKKSTYCSAVEHAHSDVLEYVMEFGIMGIIAILLLLATLIFDFIKTRKVLANYILFIGSCICVLHSCFDMSLHILSTQILFIFISVAAISIEGKERNVE